MKRLFFLLIILILSGLAFAGYKIEKIGDSWKWMGYPDPNYQFEGDILFYERIVKDEDGNEKTVKTYKEPFEIIADFKPESKVYGIEGNIEKAAIKKFGGALKGFVWLDKVSGGGEVVLPFTVQHIFIAKGDRLNPELTEIKTDSNSNNYYEIVGGKTNVFVKSFSGIGGAAGNSPTLIAHYRMNDNAASTTVIDETGNHNGDAQQNTADISVAGNIKTAFDFDGSSDYIEIADDDDFTPALTPFSIAKWVYMHDATHFIIASKGVINIDAEWQWRTQGADKIQFLLFDESVASCWIGRLYLTELTAFENQWINVVATYDGGILDSGIRLYLNGVQVDDANSDSNAGSFVAVENLTHAVWLGRYNVLYTNGLIDNIMFFSVELSQDDINILYNAGSGTEIPAELDSKISPRRGNLSPFPLRRRWEF